MENYWQKPGLNDDYVNFVGQEYSSIIPIKNNLSPESTGSNQEKTVSNNLEKEYLEMYIRITNINELFEESYIYYKLVDYYNEGILLDTEVKIPDYYKYFITHKELINSNLSANDSSKRITTIKSKTLETYQIIRRILNIREHYKISNSVSILGFIRSTLMIIEKVSKGDTSYLESMGFEVTDTSALNIFRLNNYEYRLFLNFAELCGVENKKVEPS